MNVPYEYYKVFYYVARYQSINKAAKVLSNSQPNITRTISKLETLLECRLFVRSHRGVTLTEQGEALYVYVKAASKQIQMAEALLDSFKNPQKKEIILGLSKELTNNLFQDMLIPAISAFHQDYPDTHIQIVNKPSPRLITEVYDGVVDVAVITSCKNSVEKAKETVLDTFRDIIIAGSSYIDTFRAPVFLKELSEYPLIGFGKNTESFELYDHFFAERGVDFVISIETDNPDQTLAFVNNNMGIGCVPPKYAGLQPALREGKIFMVELNEMLPERRVSLVRNERHVNAMAAILENYIFQYKEKNDSEQEIG